MPAILYGVVRLSKPWLENKKWSNATIYSGAKTGMIVLWIFTLVFGGISSVVLIAGYAEMLRDFQRGEYIVAAVLLFPLVSLLMLHLSVRMTRDWLRYGKTPLQMDPYPGAIGGEAGGYIDLKLAFDLRNQFDVKLALYRRTVRRSGKETRTDEAVVWQCDVPVHIEAAGAGTRIRFLTDVPDGKFASEESSQDYHLWRFIVNGVNKSLRFNRIWEVPMFPVQQCDHSGKASMPLPAIAQAKLEERQLNELAEITEITHQGDNIWMRFSPKNTRRISTVMFFFGALFFSVGVGMTMLEEDVPLLLVIAFGGIGGVILLAGLYGLGKELRVCVNDTEVQTKRFWFGVALVSRRYARETIESMYIESTMSMSSAEGPIQYYKLKLKFSDGSNKPIAFGIDGYSKAHKLGEQLAVLTGIDYTGD